MRYKYVFFDFDGTLADTEEVNFVIYQKLAEKYNLRNITIDELGHIKKMSAKELMAYVELKKRYLPFMLKRGKNLLKQDMKNIKPCKPDILSTVAELKKMGIKTAIITTNSKTNVEMFLEKNDAYIFDFIASASMFGKETKMRRIMKKEKLSKNEVLYVGDEIRDINAAKNAGIDIASVGWGYNTVESLKKNNPEYLVMEPNELIDICSQK
ncbi:MAG: HAD-IA family hydrolase [Sedimentibacter saalensis]|uniref:Phosphoglycolate phosphatase/epoxyqueuosine reductase n=1 Tax=Sedimentibacter saalensis TaxID=130788 RepID=A0A562J724_9FIRM|nr:HAD-IA family hydrolase [Sedimentibacter saalensis]MEA5093707.1 HAD-IA family hydrolase [Sedimentibacter saalensis]TWH78971.1 phosphoglycolate phosphatase/epoxyqueuosine reductase [Sedimentibacter saalensis]